MNKLIILVLLLSVAVLSGCEEAPYCEYHTIVKVGGCNKYGNCGVIYDDGTSGLEYYAVEGESVPIGRYCKTK